MARSQLLAAGRSAIARYAKLAPTAPGVYRMVDAAGEVLYVGKAKSIKKRIITYARPAGLDTPHHAHDRRHALHRIRLDPDRDRSASARSEPDQAAAPALQRADARRQVVSLYPHHRGSSGAADRQASRRAQPAGRLFRPVRLGLGGQPHHHSVAARLSDPLLLGRGVRKPHAAVPAAPDQALLGALHRRDRAAGLCRTRARGERTSCPARARR